MKKGLVLALLLWFIVNLGFGVQFCEAFGPFENITPGYGWYGQQPWGGGSQGWEYAYPRGFWSDNSWAMSRNYQYQPYHHWSPSFSLYYNPMFPPGSRGDGAFLGGYGSSYQGWGVMPGPFNSYKRFHDFGIWN